MNPKKTHEYKLLEETAKDLLRYLDEVANDETFKMKFFTHEGQMRIKNLEKVLKGEKPDICPRCYDTGREWDNGDKIKCSLCRNSLF